jgi:hypothetical protein
VYVAISYASIVIYMLRSVRAASADRLLIAIAADRLLITIAADWLLIAIAADLRLSANVITVRLAVLAVVYVSVTACPVSVIVPCSAVNNLPASRAAAWPVSA